MGASYEDAGVSIEAGNTLVERIKPIVKSTVRAGSDTSLGGFAGLFDLKGLGYNDPLLVACTDGVGTKLKISNQLSKHDTIGIDLVAMCVNDLIVQGAEPLFFLDYFATSSLDVDEAEAVIKGIAEGCRQAGCALIGGETAEMPGIYQAGDYDLAGFSVGAVERDNILPQTDNITEGDILIGLPSSGIHSNGYSLVRYILEQNNISYEDPFNGGEQTIGEILLEPTKIYVEALTPLVKDRQLKGMANITGGGLLENVPRMLCDNISANIDCSTWKAPEIFAYLKNLGDISEQEMLRTFNCGIGMVLLVSQDCLDNVEKYFMGRNEEYYIIGDVSTSVGKNINFSNIENLCA